MKSAPFLGPLIRGLPRLPRLAQRARVGWLNAIGRLSLGVRTLVTDGERILLVRHSYLDGWFMPGGGVERGETVAAAAARELREETGLILQARGPLLGLYANFSHGLDHVAVVPVTAWGGTLTVDGIEIVAARFFALSALPDDTSPATTRRLAEYRGEAPIADHW